MSVVEHPANTTVNATTTLTWSCLVEGSHGALVSWRNGSSPVAADGSRVEITQNQVNSTFQRSTLRIRGVEVTDSSLYSCNASNVLFINASYTSSDSRQFNLFVQSE